MTEDEMIAEYKNGLCDHGNYHCAVCEVNFRKKLKMLVFGYFDGNQDTPAYDPKNEVPCLVCWKPWTSDSVKTISLMKPGDDKSYFYRVHATCYDTLTEQEKDVYDSSLIDSLRGGDK